MKKIILPFIFLLFFVLANSSWALPSAPVRLEGTNSDVEAYLTFDYTFEDGMGILDVTLENTSPFESQITGFAFNSPHLTELTPNNITGMEGFSGDSGWKEKFDPDKIDSEEPFGSFDVAAGVTGENLKRGDPEAGIGMNDHKTFRFLFSGTNLNNLNEESFLNLNSFISDNGIGNSGKPASFIALFQKIGENGEMSDVAVPKANPSPEPGSMLLLGIGLISLASIRKKFKF